MIVPNIGDGDRPSLQQRADQAREGLVRTKRELEVRAQTISEDASRVARILLVAATAVLGAGLALIVYAFAKRA